MNDDRLPAKADQPAQTPTDHLPLRPLWLCRICGQPWPCGPAKLALLASHHDSPTSLVLCRSGLLHQAIDDLHGLHPNSTGDLSDLYDGFLGWPGRHRSRSPSTAEPPA